MESLVNAIQKTQIPTLFYIGDRDFNYELVSGHIENLQNSESLIIKGLDHVEGFLNIEKVIGPILEFLDRTKNH